MSSMSGWEFLLIVIIGLVVLGPQRLNQLANQLGSWIGQARRMTRQMKRQLEDELNVDENFNPKTPRIAPPVTSPPPDPADPAYDYGSGANGKAGDEGEPGVAAEEHVPNDDDTFSPLHEDAGDGKDKDA